MARAISPAGSMCQCLTRSRLSARAVLATAHERVARGRSLRRLDRRHRHACEPRAETRDPESRSNVCPIRWVGRSICPVRRSMDAVRRRLRVNCREDRARAEVFGCEVGVVREEFLVRDAGPHPLEHALHADAHLADAGTSAAFAGVLRDAFQQELRFNHAQSGAQRGSGGAIRDRSSIRWTRRAHFRPRASRLRRSTWIASSATSGGRTPAMRAAWPSVRGRSLASLSFASLARPVSET